ncbi:MAG: chemotaxis protein CheB [Myxococcota bacterium]
MTELVVIGASLGGFEAVSRVVRDLGADREWLPPIAAVLHRPVGSQSRLADHLSRATGRVVRDVIDGERLRAGEVHLAPPDYHLLIERDHLALSVDPPESRARPSIDVLFGSAAEAYGPRVIGVLLTAASGDGAVGLLAIRRRGGVTIAQDPASARSPVACTAALAIGAVDHLAPLERVGQVIRSMLVYNVGGSSDAAGGGAAGGGGT